MHTYILEKWVWSEEDFEVMGWHDATIYGIKLEDNKLYLDIDYIFKWHEPEVEGFYFTFHIAPCSLIFRDVEELSFELTKSLYYDLEISDLEREDVSGKYKYTIITHHGDISFIAASYLQTVRMRPSFQLEQAISFDERGGVSFDTRTEIQLSKDITEKVEERRKEEFEHYLWAKERHILKQEIEALQRKRDSGEILLKDFLKEKNAKKDKLNYYDTILTGTRYSTDQ